MSIMGCVLVVELPWEGLLPTRLPRLVLIFEMKLDASGISEKREVIVS